MNTILFGLGFPVFLALGAAATPAPMGPLVAPSAQETLDPETLERVVESLAKTVEENYVFEDVATELGAKLRQSLWDGRYEGMSLDRMTGLMTTDLRSVNNDLHLQVRPVPDEARGLVESDPEEAQRRYLEQARRGNYGFAKVEILDGNIGYLDLRGFLPASLGGETAVGAMAFLANADAIVIDLRFNGGGDPSMIQLLSSYFFEEATHLNSFQWRGKEQIDQTWTLPHVPGKKMVDVPLFILTSGRTFSAAEEFTYNLKNLERATIVGETTGGGAHPGDSHEIEGLVSVFIPQGRAINPVTGTNWEGTGIEPHMKTTAATALDVALEQARQRSSGE